MPGVRKRRTGSGGPDYRRYLLHRLRRIQDSLVASHGVLHPLVAPAYDLDRIDALEAGQDVRVTGYEISDLGPRVEPLGAYIITSNNRLTN